MLWMTFFCHVVGLSNFETLAEQFGRTTVIGDEFFIDLAVSGIGHIFRAVGSLFWMRIMTAIAEDYRDKKLALKIFKAIMCSIGVFLAILNAVFVLIDKIPR